jgi:hypothetical protein
MYYVIGAFVVSYVPALGLFVIIITILGWEQETSRVFYSLAITLVMSNSVINPIIYCWRIEDMRNAAKRLVQGICRRNENQ